MNKKNMIIPAALTALAAAALWMSVSKARSIDRAYEMTNVLVSRQDLPVGTVLNAELVETLVIPRKYMQPDAYEVRDMSDVKLVTNQVAAVSIPKGSQVVRSCLVSPGVKSPDPKMPSSQELYLDGLKYFQNADYVKAREKWQAALKQDPSNAEVRSGLKRIDQISAGGK